MVALELIHQYPFFNFLEPDQLQSIAEISKEEHLEGGKIIYHEKGQADWLYILVEGSVEMFFAVDVDNLREQRKELLFGVVNPGDMFGVSAMIEPHIHTSTARTSKPSHVIEIDAAKLRALFEKDDQLAYGFMRQAAKAIMKRLNRTLQELATAWSTSQENEDSSVEVVK
jgi:CRP-like cAMP-binding protein